MFKDYYESLNKWFEINAYPSDNGLSVFFKDITGQIKFEDERTKLTADIVQRNNDLEQFSYIISHNLRAPVANIMGLSQQLNDDIYSNETKKKFLQGLMYSVKLLDNVILDLNSVLAVRREVSQKTETVNLSELIANIESSIQNLIQNERVQINTNFSQVSGVTSIRSYLYSIFYNLITNSIKYRQHGLPALIEIKTEKNGDKIMISFKDNGSGIDLGKSGDQIFGLYKRFHKNTEGKGMGLFMVKTQVEMLGGTIAVQSEINVGTEYRIEFQS